MHRVGNVLYRPLALVLEARRHLAANGRPHRVGNRDAARLGQPLQPRGDIHPVAIDRAVGLLDDIAEMNADAEAHPPVVGDVGAARSSAS